MSSPELVASARLEELLAGAFPETQDEARLQGLARELRNVSMTAPSSLRGRVVEIGAAAQPRLQRPRRRLVVGLAALILVLGAGVLAALRFDANSKLGTEVATPTIAPRYTERGVPPAIEDDLQGRAETGPSFLGAPSAEPRAPIRRAQDVDMWIDLRVQDSDEISSASQDAVRITRDLGGVVASSTVDTKGNQGRAQLTLRIPVRNIDDGVFRLTQLGTVTAQRTSTEDLQAPLDHVSQRIAELRSKIRIELARLASSQLDAAEELEARIHLVNLRRNLREAKAARDVIVSRTSMADLTLRLATPAPGASDKSESGVSGAVDKAGDFLRGAGAVAVFLALVLSPLLVVVTIAWALLRARNRRLEARLLDEPQPGTSPRSS